MTNKFLLNLDSSIHSKLEIIDLASNPLGWSNSNGDNPCKDGNLSNSDILKLCDYRRFEKMRDFELANFAIFIDSLPVLTNEKCSQLFFDISQLFIETEHEHIHTIARVHKDYIEHSRRDLELKRLHHVTTMTIDLLDPIGDGLDSPVNITMRERNGKYGGYAIKDQKEIIDIQLIENDDDDSEDDIIIKKKTDPASELTFNLSLSEREKGARDSLILPYTINNQRKDDILKGSKIIYENDINDDYDSDDPDEDLDI